MSTHIVFPSGRIVSDSDQLRSGAGASLDGVVPIGERPAPESNSPARLKIFEETAEVYTRAQREVVRLKIQLDNRRAFWENSLDEYGLAIQHMIESRARFMKASAGIDPSTGMVIL